MGRISRFAYGWLLAALLISGCAAGDGNSPDMGKVPPKPNPNMNANLPPQVREQIAHANVGSDAQAMSRTKPH
jgi:hypothetical protein